MILTQDLLTKIDALSGLDLYRAMKVAYKGNSRPWITALRKRAHYLNQRRFGVWSEAIKMADTFDSQMLNFQDNQSVSRPNVYGYPCEIARYVKDGEIKSQWLILFHPNGQIYQKFYIKDGLPTF